MFQDIIVAIIVIAALVYTGFSVYRSVRPGEKPGSACGGCNGCELKNLKSNCDQQTPKTFSGKKLHYFPNRQVK